MLIKEAVEITSVLSMTSKTPDVHNSLPTHEYDILKSHLKREELPDNLTIRVSALLST